MITLLRKLIDEIDDRLLIGGAIVVAANAGGAWTPIGDVTTTMLWIGGQISAGAVIRELFLPSFISMIAAFALISFFLKGNFKPQEIHLEKRQLEPFGALVFFLGIASLIFVPIFNRLTGLPPFMGILLGLSVLWFVTDFAHHGLEDRSHLRVPKIMAKIDLSSLLFFLGILLAIDAMDAAKILEALAHWFDKHVGNTNLIATLIGLASSIVDNVPLVAAAMGMYSLQEYPKDHQFWQLIAFCAGTGGSILIIGSAAGVVYMGLEKVNFLWYLKRISLPALVAYFVGIAVYLMLHPTVT
jgi:Na+/H+ antiporter NhaD/arsenite permease-like protein